MSLFKTITDDEILLYVDFRSGSMKDFSGNKTLAKSAASIDINNKGAAFSVASTEFTCADVVIGTSDFSQLVSVEIFDGALTGEHFLTIGGTDANDRAMHGYNSQLYVRIDGESIISTGFNYEKFKKLTVGITADRDGDLSYFQDGIKFDSDDISAKSAYEITYPGKLFTGYGNTKQRNAYYQLVVNRVLTETEMAQLTAELENRQFPKIVTSKAFTRADGYVFDGTTDFGTITESIYVDYTKDFSYEYYWKVGSPSAIKSLFGSVIVPGEDYYGSDYFGQSESSFCFKIYDLTVGVVQSINMTYNFIEDATYKMMCSYDATTKILTGTRINLDTGVDNKTATVDLTGNNFYFKLNLLGQRGSSDRLMDGNVYDLQLTTDGKTHYVTRDAIMNTPKPTHIYVKDDVAFKTDWGVTANNTAISSGLIENTPFEVQSGSFKVIDDTYNGKSVKAIECVTDGDFKLNQNLDGTAWQLYKDTGSGYETSDGTGIIVGNVFSLTAGDKIILSDISGNNSINKK